MHGTTTDAFTHTQTPQGTIPAAIAAMRELEVLRLDGNQMYGPLPNELLALPRLRVLSLRHNHLRPFPSAPRPSAALESLDLGHNRPGPWLATLLPPDNDAPAAPFPRLTALALDGLGMESPIPAALGLACPALVALNFSQNRLAGPVPAWVGQSAHLKRLNLSQNRLTGELPPAVLVPGRWEEIKLHGNGLTGPVPFK